jgi:cell division protein FtsQ
MKKRRKKKKYLANVNCRLAIMLLSLLSLGSSIYFKWPVIDSLLSNTFFDVAKYSGFVVEKIAFDTQHNQAENEFPYELGIRKGDTIFAQSTQNIFANVAKNPWIKSLVVHKGFPNIISILVYYKKAIAIHQRYSQFVLIDENGDDIEQVAQKNVKRYNLPIIVGDNAPKNIGKALSSFSKFPVILKKINALSYVGDRRWDIIINNGMVVKLPAGDLISSLEKLELFLKNPNFNKNTIKAIDMRIKEKIILVGSKLAQNNEKKKKSI